MSCPAVGQRAGSPAGRAGGGQGQGAEAVARQHQVHRRAVQAEDADGADHARLRGQAAIQNDL